MTLIVAGERSGVGKTTVTLALLTFLKQHQLNVQSFKVGPDYIDPMFHRDVTGKACRNLDPILTSESYVKQCFSHHIQTVDYALIEGVMGLFDGIPSKHDQIPIGSTAQIAQLLNISILLVIDCSRLSSSVAAIVKGFISFNPHLKFAGLVLNKVASDRHLELLQDALEPLNIPILGVLRRQEKITIPDRNLGLVPTDELPQLNKLLEQLTQLAEKCFNWEKILPLLEVQNIVNYSSSVLSTLYPPVKIAVARDQAFSFYYPDNLEILQQLGAELIFWSPLNDFQLPKDVNGLYFGGGFPEIFAKELSQNRPVCEAVREAIKTGIPTYAECGGLMYLCEEIIDFEENSFSMVGILPTKAVMEQKLKLGYYEATALQDSPLCSQGVTVYGHQFHRSRLTVEPTFPLYQIKRYAQKQEHIKITEGWRTSENLHASYLHLHWGNNIAIPTRFLQKCQAFY